MTELSKSRALRLAPYICGILYGFFGARGLLCLIDLAVMIMWSLFEYYPYRSVYVIAVGLISGAAFIAVLVFNIRVFKRTPRTVFSLIFEIAVPILTVLPFMAAFDALDSALVALVRYLRFILT